VNKADISRVVARANRPVENSAERAAVVGDIVGRNARAIVFDDGAAAFIRWQALQFNGQWDEDLLASALDFLRHAVIIYTG
jgi:hypothetical protein